MSLVRDTSVSAISQVFGSGGRFVVTVMLARALAPAVFGKFVFVQWIIELLGLLCSFGVPAIITRFLPGTVERFGWKDRFTRILLALGVVGVVVNLAVFAVYLAFERYQPSAFQILALWCLASAVTVFANAFLQGLFLFRSLLASNVAFACVAPVAVSFASGEKSVVAAALAMAASLTAALVVGFGAALFELRRDHPDPGTAEQPSFSVMAWYGGNFWFSSLLASLVWSRGEFAILKWSVSDAEIGIYSAALSLAGIVIQGTTLLMGALSTHLARHWSRGEFARIDSILRNATLVTLICATLLAIALIGGADRAILALLGKAYRGSYEVLCILAISAICVSFGTANAVLQIETNARFGRNSSILGLIVLLALSGALIPLLGIAGAAASRACAQIGMVLYAFWELNRMPIYRNTSLRLAKSFVICVAAVVLYFGFVEYFKSHPVAVAAAGILLAAGLVLLVDRIVGATFFSALRSRLPKVAWL